MTRTWKATLDRLASIRKVDAQELSEVAFARDSGYLSLIQPDRDG